SPWPPSSKQSARARQGQKAWFSSLCSTLLRKNGHDGVAVVAVEAGAPGEAVRAEVAELDVIAGANVRRQLDRAGQDVGGVAGRAEQPERAGGAGELARVAKRARGIALVALE